MMFVQVGLGFACSLVISVIAWRLHALNRSGAIAAMLIGGVIFGLGGLKWAALLLVFFISSSALSRTARAHKQSISDKFSKGSQRDWGQVLANGGFGALCAVAHYLLPEESWLWVAFFGAMAAVNADTWATELGVLSRRLPRLLTSGKVVPVGTSGGVSGPGMFASLGGAFIIGGIAALVEASSLNETLFWQTMAAAIVGGLFGSLFDSLLGATVQGIYYCPKCQKETERHPHHHCGTITKLQRGWKWLNNDWVNFCASLIGASSAALLWYIW